VLEIVLARLDVDPASLSPLAMLLYADEVARAARFRLERDRRRFVVARATLRRLLGERLSREPRGLRFVYGAHGKPALQAGELSFNLSHSGELALYAFSRARDVGVDLEAVREVPEAERIARDWFSDADYRRFGFFGCWTRREALAKALGRDLHRLFVADYEGALYTGAAHIEALARNLVLALARPAYRTQRTNAPGQYIGLGALLSALGVAGLDESWTRFLHGLLSSPMGLNYRNELLHGFELEPSETNAALLYVGIIYLARGISISAPGDGPPHAEAPLP